MRMLNTADVFAFCRVVKATGARETLKQVAARAADKKDLAAVGLDGFLAILEAAVEPKTEELVYRCLAGPLECTAQEVAEMPLTDLAQMLGRLAEENDLRGFFGFVSGIMDKG